MYCSNNGCGTYTGASQTQSYSSPTLSYGSAPSSQATYAPSSQRPQETYVTPSMPAASEEVVFFEPQSFVTKHTQFVGKTEEVQEYVKEAYEKLTKKKLPENIAITLCSSAELKHAHNFFDGTWSEGIQGFCINRQEGVSYIFVKEDELAKVMLTIGHELGHLQSATLGGVEEEAKAFAFSMAWMDTLQEHNIANLRGVFVTQNPARNGLHNVAFTFVIDKLKEGMKALEVFTKLIEGMKIELYKYTAHA